MDTSVIQFKLFGIGYSKKVTPLSRFAIGEVTLSKADPLSVDLTMFPEKPTATNVLFPKVTAKRLFAVGEVTLSKDEPFNL